MALMDFIKKQFIDIIQWTEEGDGTLAWRFPMAEMEIQNGASLTVRESQMAVFVNEGKVADVFGPGMYKLTTQTIPVLTYLKNWDKLFQSPFKSDVYFFSTRQQIDQKWGTPQPITIRDKDFGAVRLRAFGNYAYRIVDPKAFYTEISGTRASYPVGDLEGQLRGLVLQNISNAIAGSGVPFLDLAANQVMSMIFDGLFDRYPTLKIVFVEHAFTWILPLMWRMDAIYEARKQWVDIKRKPSDYVKDHIKFTTQPLDYPEDKTELMRAFEWMECEKILLFSSDYPHWTFDDPRWLVKHLPEPAREAVMFRNGLNTYHLPDTVPALEGQVRVF